MAAHRPRQRKPPKAPKPAPVEAAEDPPASRCDARDHNGWACYQSSGKHTHRFMSKPMPTFPPMGPPDRPNRHRIQETPT